MKKKITIILVTFVVLIFIGLLLGYKEIPSKTIEKPLQNTGSMEAEVKQVYTDGQVQGLMAFNDQNLIDFYQNNLQKVCPFYEPDGVTYRSCVLDLIQKEKNRLSKKSIAIENADKYCSDGAAKTTDDYSLGYADIHNTCLLYRLRQL